MGDQPADGRTRGLLKWALWSVGLAGVAAVVYIMAQASFQPGGSSDVKRLAKGEMAKLTLPADAGPAPANAFYDAAGAPKRIADFRGKVVVVNLWATWCAPCVVEMPTLAKLARAYEGAPVEVVAISIDGETARDKAQAFIGQHPPLAFYIDPKAKLPFALTPPAAGVPATIIYGKDGAEFARLSGDADWSSREARAVIDAALARD
jgi:thiol-disulfide isomerase/thioredoxin